MKYSFSKRIQKTPKSFIREILKVTQRPEVISFAGGLPNPDLIDIQGISRAAQTVIEQDGKNALQYSTTEGYLPLREFIADRYRKRYDLCVKPEEILITNGSQQCLDLIGKIFINNGDAVAIERPGYLGAIQALSLYQPEFFSVPLENDGPDTEELKQILSEEFPKLFYAVPNSQNPSGITYSEEKRHEVADILNEAETLFVEDDAYGELHFSGKVMPPVKKFMPEYGIMTGSFSKIVSPGMRMGWICAPEEIIDKIATSKQAADLHSNYLSQRIIEEYLRTNDLDAHISKINAVYKSRCDLMLKLMDEMFPEEVSHTTPNGGMFIWLTLPDGLSSTKLFEKAMEKNVAVLPGHPFYFDGGGDNTARINYSNADEESIRKGIEILAGILKEQLK
ncbi:PLP-dependent aminotransferase family protein [Methanoplanus sp. FWC-SCC4]|uniref:PLP-dependent aminotransferase family protein n=1 Tax=Methanochimaera problematica TaxID=2609417 RepID=A0AA97FBX8_9EURY|nr:PLP-dependent aminotransferase family protein [Methanoplanus sp. FWC-SCC4]WOF16047.1 PLP-dependent aminotransferase family protein [Methanoplanus sp. FWC-SCC4]